MFAVALGSLVTLIPISISGLGTRELHHHVHGIVGRTARTCAGVLTTDLLRVPDCWRYNWRVGLVVYPVPIRTQNSSSEGN